MILNELIMSQRRRADVYADDVISFSRPEEQSWLQTIMKVRRCGIALRDVSGTAGTGIPRACILNEKAIIAVSIEPDPFSSGRHARYMIYEDRIY